MEKRFNYKGENMKGIILALLVAVLVFLFFRFFLYRKEDSIDTPIVYVCDECGKKHCICHREGEMK